MFRFLPVVALVSCCALFSAPQQQGSQSGPDTDSSFIDAEGTAHVTRVVPIPDTISPEAKKVLARRTSDAPQPDDLQKRRSGTDAWQNRAGDRSRTLYPVNVERDAIAGVPVRVITPLSGMKPDRVLMNLHGGGFNSDSGSLTESIPIANLTKTKVVAVLYRLAPEHPFPAAVDDSVAVYKELLKTYKPANIAVYGTSAGAILTGEVAVKLRQLGLPLPGALGVFSGFGDFSKPGDSMSIYALAGFSGYLHPPAKGPHHDAYMGSANPQDPVLSPIFADLHGFPPTLFITSTRDLLLSGTANMHRAFLRAGVDAQLVVFDALAHAFWNDADLPESKETYEIVSGFFDKNLGK